MRVVDSSGLGCKELEQLLARTVFDSVCDEEKAVASILDEVRRHGDAALRKLTARFDGVKLTDLKVGKKEFAAAYNLVSKEFLDALALARDNIADFSRRQLQNSWFKFTEKGSMLGEIWRPLASVGCYAPGGTARYPSSVLMTVVPAVAAGVERVYLSSPARSDGSIDPRVLVAAAEAGAHTFYKLGGAQAIAAMAFGTESVSRVDKIVGPGNIYVTLAKRAVFGYVDIDMLAGPSEVLVLADKTTDPSFAAADMLAQAEHDPRARAILVTTDQSIALAVKAELSRQLAELPRRDIAEASLKNGGLLLLAPDMDKALELVNMAAPEHLIVLTENPQALLPRITAAGALFLGDFSPESVGDYLAGPNHVLPTSSTARFSSPLSAWEFIKRSSLISYSCEELASVADSINLLAAVEGLEGHAAAVRIRMDKLARKKPE